MVSGPGRDKPTAMNESESSDEPKATPWPKKVSRQPVEAWPPDLDEDTWNPEESAVPHEE